MTNKEIYKLAAELTEKEINNILNYWEENNFSKYIELFNSLVSLGDSKPLALSTALAEKYNKKDTSNSIYELAYYS